MELENRKQPLGEVFGYRINDASPEAKTARKTKACPYGNAGPVCTKVRVLNPIGACSLFAGDKNVVICPVRFRDPKAGLFKTAAEWFFPGHKNFGYMREIGIADKNELDAGNIDYVITKLDENGKVIDFGSLEVQSVYISGNISLPFDSYISDPDGRGDMDWSDEAKYPVPDWLSSTRKRLAPQMMWKGGILRAWKKKLAVAMDRHLFATMPSMPTCHKKEAEIAWFLYDLKLNDEGRYDLCLVETKYTDFDSTLKILTKCEAGDVDKFIQQLEATRIKRAKQKK